jgi:DNA-binding phage protein
MKEEKMKKKNIENLTIEELKAAGLCEIADEDFDTLLIKQLSKSRKAQQDYRLAIIDEFNETKNIDIFLIQMKKLAKARELFMLAKKTNLKKPNYYKSLSAQPLPKDKAQSSDTLTKTAYNAGIIFNVSAA